MRRARDAMRWPRLEAEFVLVGESPAGHRGQIMKMLTSVDLFAAPKRTRNTKEWFERAKLVVATARDRAVEMAQQREATSMTPPPTLLQRCRLAKRLSAKPSRGKRRAGRS
jgi:isopropylmalate/homocitrate/citramalate synthase